MNRNLVILPLLWAAGAVGAQDKEEGVFEPGVRHVCVPAADGSGWDCGTEDSPPKDYQPPAAEAAPEPQHVAESAPATTEAATEVESEDSPAPPFFLADPMRRTPYAPVQATPREPETAAEAVVAAEAEPSPAESVQPTSAAADAATVEAAPVVAVPAEATPGMAASGSVSEEAGRAERVAGPAAAPDEAIAEPTPAPTPAPTPTPQPPQIATVAGELADATDFAQLPATAYTLQLAYAPDPSGFPALVAGLGLDPATCYVLRVRGSNGPTWLLAHGAFADANAARAAQAALPKVAGLSAQWPRRIGALQTEITQGL
ncbi:MAG: hypothetical protein HYV17_05135 [Xanthomonadales bacterium]|nr:hypothetical protein [Xanthomonadales bacterium]